MDIDFSKKADVSADEYLKMIEFKGAFLKPNSFNAKYLAF